jgi:hypothetical protein
LPGDSGQFFTSHPDDAPHGDDLSSNDRRLRDALRFRWDAIYRSTCYSIFSIPQTVV